jgi:hypothetical protein
MSWSRYNLLCDATYQWCLDPDAIFCMMLHTNDGLIRLQFTGWCYISLMSWSGYDLLRDDTHQWFVDLDDLLCDATYQWCFDRDTIYCRMLHIHDILIWIQFTAWCYFFVAKCRWPYVQELEGWRGGFTWRTAYLNMALILANASLDPVHLEKNFELILLRIGKFYSFDKIHG